MRSLHPLSTTNWLLPFALSLSLLAGSIPQLAAAQQVALPPQARMLTLGVGSIYNEFDNNATFGYSATPAIHSHRSRAGGAEAAYQWAPKVGRPFDVVGGGIWAGAETVDVYSDPAGYASKAPTTFFGDHALHALHIYAEGHKITTRHQLDCSYRLGLYVGQLAHFADDRGQDATTNNILPEYMLAIGRRRTVFGQLDVGYGAGNALGNYTARLALGSGLGRQHGGTVLAGYALGPSYPAGSMGFISANLRLPMGPHALSLEPYVASNFGRHHVASLHLNYLLGQ